MIFFLQLSQHWYESLLKLVEGNANFVYSVLLYIKLKQSIKGFFIWIKNRNTIKFLVQAVTFLVESTCIPRGILHSHGEERVYRVGRGVPVKGVWRGGVPVEIHVCQTPVPLPCAVPVMMCWIPECEKLWLSSLYFLGTYFQNNTVIDFPIQ